MRLKTKEKARPSSTNQTRALILGLEEINPGFVELKQNRPILCELQNWQSDSYLKKGVSKSIVHVIKHANF